MKRMALILMVLGCASTAWAQDLTGKLPEGYASASPSDKMVMISTAVGDQLIKGSKDRQAAQKEVDSIFLAELNKGETSEKKLLLLGALRKETKEKCSALNKERRKEKKRSAGFMEPNSNLQCAVAMSYVVDKAGGKPTLTQLECLSIVRENTSWFSHGSLTLSLVTEALYRDSAFLEADSMGKLEIISTITEGKKMLSSQEQKYLDKAILCDWMDVQLKEGKSPTDLLALVKDLGKQKKVCFFTRSWAKGVLEKLALVR